MAKDTTTDTPAPAEDTAIRIGDVVTVKSGAACQSCTMTVVGLHTNEDGQECAALMWRV